MGCPDHSEGPYDDDNWLQIHQSLYEVIEVEDRHVGIGTATWVSTVGFKL